MTLKDTIMRQLNERRKDIVARDRLELYNTKKEIMNQKMLPPTIRDTYYLTNLQKYQSRLNSEIRRNERRIKPYNA